MLSICVTIKNRSFIKTEHGVIQPFPTFIRSLNSCLSLLDDEIELVVSDWESDDKPLREWLDNTLHEDIQLHLVTIEGNGFSKGYGANVAADHAASNNLFFCDADMIVNSEAINRGIKELKNGNTFYPVVNYELEPNGKQIIHEGGGNLFISKKNFYSVDCWPEFWEHGFEDTKFHEKLVERDYNIVTDDDVYIFHPWHPQGDFKNRYAINRDAEVQKSRQKLIKELQKEEDEFIKSIQSDIVNSNTTHQNLNKVAKGKNGGILI